MADDVGPLDIMVRSLTCTEAIDVLRNFAVKEFIEPLSESLEAPAMRRAALVTAFLTGISILRNVIGIEALREAERGELETMVRSTLTTMVSKSIPYAGGSCPKQRLRHECRDRYPPQGRHIANNLPKRG